MEVFIPIVILLFLLSLISERISNFLKLNLPEVPEGRKFWKFIPGGPFRTQSEDPDCEKIRERRIAWLALISGFTVAFLAKANIFSMFRYMDRANETLWWYKDAERAIKDYHEPLGEIIIGCILTSLFISLGSKFWHDLLDLLLEVKNLKRKLNDERTFQLPETIEQFDDFINTPEGSLAFLADEKHHETIAELEGVISVGPGYIFGSKGKVGCLEVHFTEDADTSQVADHYNVTLSSGLVVPIPVNKIITGHAIAQAGIFGGGMLLGNNKKVNGIGTAGCVVKKKGNNELHILSCYHVFSGLTDLKLDSTNADVNKIFYRDGSNELPLGELTEGERTQTIDAAIARIRTTDHAFNNGAIFNPKQIRKVTSDDVVADTQVRIYGGMSGNEVYGLVHNDSWPQKLVYKDHPEGWELKDLLVLTKRVGANYKSLTIEGDSGSLVIDRVSNEVLGMVVGGDKCFTYAIKMTEIEKRLKIDLL
ncbi:hypothetical protein [Chitinophaga sp. RAB17]|uniref:hypothetical protein n=1 Tax=Chitinophaga sp. RAB17 TaxID=3233049 RepID=UPI003F8E27BF